MFNSFLNKKNGGLLGRAFLFFIIELKRFIIVRKVIIHFLRGFNVGEWILKIQEHISFQLPTNNKTKFTVSLTFY